MKTHNETTKFPTLSDYEGSNLKKSYESSPLYVENLEKIEKSAHGRHKYLTIKGEGKKKRYIYDHAKMNANDHRNAADFHYNEHRKARPIANMTGLKEDKDLFDHHSKLSYEHENAGNQKEYEKSSIQGKSIGQTKSGKTVWADKNASDVEYKDFSDQDHEDAEMLHDAEAKKHKTGEVEHLRAHHNEMSASHNKFIQAKNNQLTKSIAYEILGLDGSSEPLNKAMGVGNSTAGETLESGHATNNAKVNEKEFGKLKPNEKKLEHKFDKEGNHTHTNYYDKDDKLSRQKFNNNDKIEKSDFSSKERDKLSNEKEAEPDGSYPIRNTSDLHNAIQAFGRSKDKDKTKAWIKKRAKELNAEGSLPKDWK